MMIDDHLRRFYTYIYYYAPFDFTNLCLKRIWVLIRWRWTSHRWRCHQVLCYVQFASPGPQAGWIISVDFVNFPETPNHYRNHFGMSKKSLSLVVVQTLPLYYFVEKLFPKDFTQRDLTGLLLLALK